VETVAIAGVELLRRESMPSSRARAPELALPAPRIFAVGGGKGGVGKSIVASNLALALAATGQRVAVVDLDLGGANLHTLFGISRPRATLADFVRGDVTELSELLSPTSVPDVALISGARALPDMANPKTAHKQKLLRHLRRLLSPNAIRTADDLGLSLDVLKSVEAVNECQKLVVLDKVKRYLGADLKGKTIAVWGLAFKPQTDDMRDAPSLTLIEDLLEAGATVSAHDPASMNEARHKLGDRIRYAETNYDALSGADALVVVTDWNEYRHPDFSRVKALLRRPVVIDGRNLYDPAKMADLGFTYHSIGRQIVEHPAPERVGEYA